MREQEHTARLSEACLGVIDTRVAFLSRAESKIQHGPDAMDRDEDDKDNDLLDRIADAADDNEDDLKQSGHVHLQTGDFNARKKDPTHIKVIADALVRGENLLRKYPIIIAVSKTDVANVDDFMKEEEAAVATMVPIVHWQEGVTAVMVLAG